MLKELIVKELSPNFHPSPSPVVRRIRAVDPRHSVAPHHAVDARLIVPECWWREPIKKSTPCMVFSAGPAGYMTRHEGVMTSVTPTGSQCPLDPLNQSFIGEAPRLPLSEPKNPSQFFVSNLEYWENQLLPY